MHTKISTVKKVKNGRKFLGDRKILERKMGSITKFWGVKNNIYRQKILVETIFGIKIGVFNLDALLVLQYTLRPHISCTTLIPEQQTVTTNIISTFRVFPYKSD